MAAPLLRRASSSLSPLAGSFCTISHPPKSSLSALNGLPFDTVEKDPEGRFVTLTRKTKDEIIEIRAKAPEKNGDFYTLPPLSFLVRILYGNNFNTCFEAKCEAHHDNHFAVREISFQSEDKGGGRKHLEGFEDFFKERGIEPRNFNFLLDYISKQDEIKKD